MALRSLATFAACALLAPMPGRALAEPGAFVYTSFASAVIVSARVGVHRDAIGAGVVVAALPYGLRIATARHVADAGDLTVWIERRPYAAELVRTFAERDVAIVDALVPSDVRSRTNVARSAGATAAGDALTVWGENDAGPHMQTARLVAPAWQDPRNAARPPLLSIACDGCARGDSGAGVFDADGGLLGILTARYRTTDGAVVAVVAEPVDASLYAPNVP